MADRKLTQLTNQTSHDPDDLMYIVRNSTSYKMRTGEGFPVRFDTRSDIVTYLSGTNPPTNTILKAADTGLEWLYDGSSTDISDMSGCIPLGLATLRHWGCDATEYGSGIYPSTPSTDDTTKIQEAFDYCITKGFDLDGEGFCYGITDTITWGENTTSISSSNRGPRLTNSVFVVIGGTWSSGSLAGDDPTAWTFGDKALVIGKNHTDTNKVKVYADGVIVDAADTAPVGVHYRGVNQSTIANVEVLRATEAQHLAGVHGSDKDSCTASHLTLLKGREASFGDEKYGASGTDGAVSSGSTTFSSPSASFVAGDVGKSIAIRGAGSSGNILETTISAVTDSQTVTLADAASTTVSGEYYVYLKERTSIGFANYSSDVRISKGTFNNCKYSGLLASGFNFTAEQCVFWNGFKRLWEDSRSLWIYEQGGTRQVVNNRIDDGQTYIQDFPGLNFSNNILIQYGDPLESNNPSADKAQVAWSTSSADETAQGMVFRDNIISSTRFPQITLETTGSGSWAEIEASYGGNTDYGFNDITVQGLIATLSDDMAVMDQRLVLGHGKATGGDDVVRIRYDGDNFFITPTDAAGSFDFKKQIRYEQTQGRWNIGEFGDNGYLPHYFETRSDFVSWASGNTYPNDTVILAGGYFYKAESGATDISDISGWVPKGPGVFPDHFGENVTPFTTDMTSAIQDAYDYVASHPGHTLNLAGGYRTTSTLNFDTEGVVTEGTGTHSTNQSVIFVVHTNGDGIRVSAGRQVLKNFRVKGSTTRSNTSQDINNSGIRIEPPDTVGALINKISLENILSDDHNGSGFVVNQATRVTLRQCTSTDVRRNGFVIGNLDESSRTNKDNYTGQVLLDECDGSADGYNLLVGAPQGTPEGASVFRVHVRSFDSGGGPQSSSTSGMAYQNGGSWVRGQQVLIENSAFNPGDTAQEAIVISGQAATLRQNRLVNTGSSNFAVRVLSYSTNPSYALYFDRNTVVGTEPSDAIYAFNTSTAGGLDAVDLSNVSLIDIDSSHSVKVTGDNFTNDFAFYLDPLVAEFNAIRSIASPRVDLNISSGVINVTNTYHTVDTESSASTDDLDTINGGRDGMMVVLRPISDSRSVVVKHNTGNILCQGSDIVLNSTASNATLIYDETANHWIVTSVRVPTNKLLLEN